MNQGCAEPSAKEPLAGVVVAADAADAPAVQRGARRCAPSYPASPDDAAYYGLAGRFVETVEPHTESAKVAILVQTLLAYGSVIGRSAYFTAEADRHYANLFAVLEGVSAKGRKGSSWGVVKRLVELVDNDWLLNRQQGGLSSGEGLISAVRDRVTKLTAKASAEPAEIIVDDGVSDKRLLAFEPEFASVLRVLNRDGSTLSPLIRQAWDDGNLQTLTKNSPARATGAHVSILGHITDEELRRYLERTEAGNGFANRFLWVCTKRSKSLPEGGNIPPLNEFALEVREAVAFARTVGEVRRDGAAKARWAEVYERLSAGNPGLAGAVTSRAEAQVMRLAMIYALLDMSAEIRCEHLEAALSLWRYVEDSARYVFGDSLGNPVADRLLAEFRQVPAGLDRTAMNKLLSGNRESWQIDAALALLNDKGHIRRVVVPIPDKGRPPEIWAAC